MSPPPPTMNTKLRKRNTNTIPKVVHRRTRTGCVTCRKRRIKCDEARPICERCRKGDRECSYTLVLTFKPDPVPTKMADNADRTIKPHDEEEPEELRDSLGASSREEAESILPCGELEEKEETAVSNPVPVKWHTAHPKTPPPSMATVTFLQPIRWTPPSETLGSVHTPQRSREPIEGQTMASGEGLDILGLQMGGGFEVREASRATAQLHVKTPPHYSNPDGMTAKTVLQPIRWTPARKTPGFSNEEEGYYGYLGAKNIVEGSGGIKQESLPTKAVLGPIRWSYRSSDEK
ncbi:hypothetical protein K440DRAFT_301490 [Wilcoxina mikolae CBS 423.85]|nr:hypothetical protein K440DRAFT_301490 [Wilcoxina mikolae CBS 423.85]